MAVITGCAPAEEPETVTDNKVINLPQPLTDSGISVEGALRWRRSERSYEAGALTLAQVSQLLLAAQGITGAQGLRTAPSAGALYPLEVYLIVGDVVDLGPGIYRYQPRNHQLVRIGSGDKRQELVAAALGQTFIGQGAVSLVFTAVYERTTWRYGERGIRYVHMEAGHAAQNVYLQAVALKLGTVVVGAFHDDQVRQALGLPQDEHPLYIMPVGRI